MESEVRKVSFTFKRFSIDDRHCGMKVGTDGVVLGAWASCTDAKNVIDVGAGSGLIALMIAQRSNASITAIEIDSGAVFDARANIAASPWSDRLKVIESDFSNINIHPNPDLIVSNPPFFANGETAPSVARAGARHEGTLNYATLINYAAEMLAPCGKLAFIYQSDRDDDIIYKAEMSRLKLRRICHLRQRVDAETVRTLFEFCRIDGPIERSILTIRDTGGKYTDEFSNLTQDFYL